MEFNKSIKQNREFKKVMLSEKLLKVLMFINFTCKKKQILFCVKTQRNKINSSHEPSKHSLHQLYQEEKNPKQKKKYFSLFEKKNCQWSWFWITHE
jgi:hypothetical protein